MHTKIFTQPNTSDSECWKKLDCLLCSFSKLKGRHNQLFVTCHSKQFQHVMTNPNQYFFLIDLWNKIYFHLSNLENKKITLDFIMLYVSQLP